MTGIHLVAQESAGYLWAHIIFLYVLAPICLGLGLAFFVFFIVPTRGAAPDYIAKTNSPFAATVSILAGILAAGAFVGMFIGLNWPLQAQYHYYEPTTITVSQIGSRFLSDGNGGTNQRYVFEDKNGIPYAVDDTRASLVKVGQTVTLLCVREWQQNGVPGYACNWGEMGVNG